MTEHGNNSTSNGKVFVALSVLVAIGLSAYLIMNPGSKTPPPPPAAKAPAANASADNAAAVSAGNQSDAPPAQPVTPPAQPAATENQSAPVEQAN